MTIFKVPLWLATRRHYLGKHLLSSKQKLLMCHDKAEYDRNYKIILTLKHKDTNTNLYQ